MKKKILGIGLIILVGLSGFWYFSKKDKDNTIIDYNYSDTTEISGDYDEDDLNDSETDYDTTITLSDSLSIYEGVGVSINSSTITINSPGTYLIQGTLANGQIIVETNTKGVVRIILDNVSINCDDSSAILVKQASKTVITLVGDNFLSDGSTYTNVVDEEPNSTIFSQDDLTINGNGNLNIDGNYENGITSKDTLTIISGTINIDSNNIGIKGKDCLVIKDGNITINSNGEGLKSTNDTDTEAGYILIDGGIINITSSEDGIEAANYITINDGSITIKTGGGSFNSSTSSSWGSWNSSSSVSTSAKSIKAVNIVSINGGTININSSDDSIHTNDTVIINGGTINLTSGDDGIHADTELIINNGIININKSYEGLESTSISINDGAVYIVASDDGVNAAGGADSSATSGRPGEGSFSSSTGSLIINGGYIYVDSTGDGLDANGDMTINGGTIIVEGPTDNGNTSLDFDGSLLFNGGTVFAVGSSGMIETPSSSSSQNSIVIALNEIKSSGTLINLTDSSGNSIISFESSQVFQAIIISSPDLVKNSSYSLYFGGTNSGDKKNGLYTGGTFTGGSLYTTLTLNNSVTSYGTTSRTR
ncbi:MAG: carbohydrate-binding domain-containing protein [Bacilli bacterium]